MGIKDGKDKGENKDEKKDEEIKPKIDIIINNNLKDDVELLWDEIQSGVKGENSGIPMGFPRLNNHISLRKSIFTTVGATAGCGKCLGKGTKILMYDGTFMKVENIEVGDLLMSTNSTPNKVLSIGTGTEQMYEIVQKNGNNYVVNESHILSLKFSSKKNIDRFGKLQNISVKNYLNLKKSLKGDLKGYKIDKISFKEIPISLDPYFLGVWLGDGTSSKPDITTKDTEVVDFLKKYCLSVNTECQLQKDNKITYSIKAIRNLEQKNIKSNKITLWESARIAGKMLDINEAYISRATKNNKIVSNSTWKWIVRDNFILKSLQNYNLIKNKHIPNNYLYNTEHVRLELLAGLIDTDGHYSSRKYYEIIQKNNILAEQITYLSRSLGFRVNNRKKKATMKRKDGSIYTSIVNRISISGEIHKIPVKINRKRADVNKPNKDNKMCAIEVKKINIDKYYGFTIGGNSLFMLEDFTVTHNTSFVDSAYVLNPYDWYIKNQTTSKIKFECIYFSMERKKTYKLAKWLCMKIWKEQGILMTTNDLLSWKTKLSQSLQDTAKYYIDNYLKEMVSSGIVKIIDGPINPTGMWVYMHEYALQRGTEHEVSQYEKVYVAKNTNVITNVVHDHIGKTKNENVNGKYDKKTTIDKASEYHCKARDHLGYSPIVINQFNRTSYTDIQFAKKSGLDPDPTVEYWKDSGNIIEDCDVAISLFNPYKYNIDKYMDYNVEDFKDMYGNNKFRGLKIIKNSYGTENLRIALAFLGEVGLYKELTKSDSISSQEINSVINNNIFK